MTSFEEKEDQRIKYVLKENDTKEEKPPVPALTMRRLQTLDLPISTVQGAGAPTPSFDANLISSGSGEVVTASNNSE